MDLPFRGGGPRQRRNRKVTDAKADVWRRANKQFTVIQSIRHRPFEVVIVFTVLLTGIASSFNKSPVVAAIEQTLPFYGYVWNIGLILSGTVGVISIIMNMPSTLIVERISMSLMATLFIAYGFTVVFIIGTSSIAGVLSLFAFGTGAFARIIQITGDLKKIEGLIKTLERRDADADTDTDLGSGTDVSGG